MTPVKYDKPLSTRKNPPPPASDLVLTVSVNTIRDWDCLSCKLLDGEVQIPKFWPVCGSFAEIDEDNCVNENFWFCIKINRIDLNCEMESTTTMQIRHSEVIISMTSAVGMCLFSVSAAASCCIICCFICLHWSKVMAWLSGSSLGLDQRSYCTSGPVNTWMGDRLSVNQLGITSHLGQLSLSSFRGCWGVLRQQSHCRSGIPNLPSVGAIL